MVLPPDETSEPKETVDSEEAAEPEAKAETVADLGELALIERLSAFCTAGMVGDDAALLTVRSGHQLVVTTDMLTEGVHFSDRTTPPETVGWRATAANLSDLAAMGASPLGITLALGLPAKTPWNWVEALYQGVADCLKQHGGMILGGDVCRAAQRTVSITALGEVIDQQAVRRDSASAGMAVVVTGPHGGSRAGLAVLLGELTAEDNSDYHAHWIQAHQKPVPRFDAIAQLRQLIDRQLIESRSETPYPTIAGMDSSDGLANALLQISSSSQIGIDVVRSQIPLPLGLKATVGADTALEWALYGGEDFELVLCLSFELAKELAKAGVVSIIGTTTHDSNVVQLLDAQNSSASVQVVHKSFQHF